MTESARPIIREATPADAAACAAIYAPYVSDTPASFEEVPPEAAEMAGRIKNSICWLVAEIDAEVVGYAYGARHRERSAYRWAADVTVYVDACAQRRGLGRALYAELFPRLRARGIWTLCAGIAEPNEASTALHRAVGFQLVGTYERIGFKAGSWRDVTWLQLHLREPSGIAEWHPSHPPVQPHLLTTFPPLRTLRIVVAW